VLLLRQRLDELSALVAAPVTDMADDVRGWLARLLVVRSCGYLEQSVVSACRGYVDGRSGGPVRAFGASFLMRSSNPSAAGLQALVGRFDARWSEELEELLDADDERLRRDLGFLVDRRHKIAHGLNETVRVSRSLELKDNACELSDWFVRRFNPQRI
jgi:hypothetical protein